MLALDWGAQLCCLGLHNNNRNEVNKQQSLNFDKNQAEQETESQITYYKDALYSKQLFYVVHLQCNLSTAGFFVICVISDVAHAYTHLCSPCHIWDKLV